MSARAMHIPVGEAPGLVGLPKGDHMVLRNLVGGDFECVPIANGLFLWVNEHGKSLALLENPNAQTLWDDAFGPGDDIILGPVVLTSGADDNGNTIGITDEQLRVVERLLNLVRVRVVNAYSDGHESTSDYWFPTPESIDALEPWWEDEVFDYTGDGHGAKHPELDSHHECTIISGPTNLVGQRYEWG